MLFSSSTLAAALSEILEVDCGLLALVTCLLPWLTNKTAAPDSDDKDPQVNVEKAGKDQYSYFEILILIPLFFTADVSHMLEKSVERQQISFSPSPLS